MSIDEEEKSERVCTYLTPTKKSAIETASGDQSVASWIRGAINQRLKADQQEEILEGTNAEQRLEALVAEAADDLEESTEKAAAQIQAATQQYHDLLAINAVYSVGSFRLLGDFGDFGDLQRKTAIENGVDRIQESDLPELDLTALGVDSTATAETDARASESRAQNQQDSDITDPRDRLTDDSDDSTDLDDILGDE